MKEELVSSLSSGGKTKIAWVNIPGGKSVTGKSAENMHFTEILLGTNS